MTLEACALNSYVVVQEDAVSIFIFITPAKSVEVTVSSTTSPLTMRSYLPSERAEFTFG